MIAPLSRHVHVVGIGGSGASGLARLHLELGDRVSGSDMRPGPALEELADLGARVRVGHDAANLDPDVALVIRSAAVGETNPEVREARARGLPVIKYAEAVGGLMQGRLGVAVAGTHGKTTTSGMTAVTLDRAGLDPMYLVGGVPADLGAGARSGRGPFVVEACEYDRSFLHLEPEFAAVLNVDDDHLDCYGGLEEIRDAFLAFGRRVRPGGLLLVHESADFLRCAAGPTRVETFGSGPTADWCARDAIRVDGRTRFVVLHRGERHGVFEILPAGTHNVHNSLVPIAVAHELGVDARKTAAALAGFSGMGRRLQVRVRDRFTVYDDYAHHPTEVAAALRALRADHPHARLTAVFQPHQYSRTRRLLDRFAEALLGADRIVVADIYRARDREEDVRAVSSGDLADAVRARGGDAEHVSDFRTIADRLERETRRGDVVVTMGAGNIDEVADEMARRMGGKCPARAGA
jgi:UDP-N-acetylmuramate--alanine ligase